MFKQLLVLLALASLATGCHKDDEEPTIDFGPNGGFSMRDVVNRPGAQTDPTDWTHDATWISTEQNLFSSLGVTLGSSAQQGGTWYCSVYPNPVQVNGRANFTVFALTGSQSTPVPATAHAQLVVVDAKYKVLTTLDQLVGKGAVVPLSFPDATYSANSLYRVYYVVYEPTLKTVYYRGHGDVKIEN